MLYLIIRTILFMRELFLRDHFHENYFLRQLFCMRQPYFIHDLRHHTKDLFLYILLLVHVSVMLCVCVFSPCQWCYLRLRCVDDSPIVSPILTYAMCECSHVYLLMPNAESCMSFPIILPASINLTLFFSFLFQVTK